MQQIERYGVIALLFLLVTIVVVALWDGGETSQAAEGDQVAQVEAAKTPVATRNTIQRPRNSAQTRPSRGTSTQARNQAQAQADRRTSLSRQGNRNSATQRNRLLNPNGVPANPQARSARRPVRGNTDSRTASNAQAMEALARTTVPAPFKAEPRRPRNTNQWENSTVPVANRTPVAVDPVPAVRNMVAKNKPRETVRKAEPTQGPVYVVKNGDSLARIARYTLGKESRWREIQALNGLKTDVVRAGMKLRLPAGADASRTSVATAKKMARGISQAASSRTGAPRANTAGTYLVKKGDSLGLISQRLLGRASLYPEIMKLNPGLTPKNLRAGTRINMPASAKSTGKAVRSNKPSKRAKAKKQSRYTVH